jgi:hypothetical protein
VIIGGTLTCGFGAQIWSDASDYNLRLYEEPTVNTVIWGGGTGLLTLEFWDGMNIAGDDYGDCDLSVDGSTSTFSLAGDVTTTGDVYTGTDGFDGRRVTLALGSNDLTCENLDLGVSGEPQQNGGLTMGTGATLTVNGNLTVHADSGTYKNEIACVGSPSIYLNGDVEFDTNDQFTRATSDINIAGDTAQSIDFAGASIHDLYVTNTDAVVSFVAGLDVDGTFKPGNGSSSIDIEFTTSGSHYFDAIDTSNASGTGAVSLDRIGASGKWDLTIGSNETVTSLDVANSNLTGNTIDATDTTNVDGGNNSTNWIFEIGGAPLSYYHSRRRK